MRALTLTILAALLVGCGGPIDANIDLPLNAVLLRVHPANLPVRHVDDECPNMMEPYEGNFLTEPPLDGGSVSWKAFVNLPRGWHCFYVLPSEAEALGVEGLAFEVWINDDEYTAPEEAWVVGIPLGVSNGSK